MIEEQSPKQKPVQWKIIIPVAIVVVLCCICLAVAGVLAYMGTKGSGPLSMLATNTSTPTSTPTPTHTPIPTRTSTPIPQISGDWDFYYSWDCNTYNSPADNLTFSDNGTYEYTYSGQTGSSFGTWFVYGDTLDFIYDDSPHAHYTGTLNTARNYATGTMKTDDGSTGCWNITKK